MTLTAAFHPGGCLHGYHQVRVARFNAYFGVAAAEAAACHNIASQQEKGNAAAAAAATAALVILQQQVTALDSSRYSADMQASSQLEAATDRGPNKAYKVCRNMATHSSQADIGNTSVLLRQGDTQVACQQLRGTIKSDILGLTSLGWRAYFGGREQPQQSDSIWGSWSGAPQSQAPPAAGYVDKYLTSNVRYGHKSIIDPNFAAGYAVHEASTMIHCGRDTGHAVPFKCAFGLHLFNMFKFRWLGSGQELVLGDSQLFSLSDYVQRVTCISAG